MIITTEIQYEVNSGNRAYLQKITSSGLNIGDVISVSIDKIGTGSNSRIDVQCGCGNIKNVVYKAYTRTLKKSGLYRCVPCCSADNSRKSVDKIKQTNLERYGVENVFQLEETKQKTKETSLEKYGTEYTAQSDFVKEKSRNTNLERYGAENPFQVEEFKDKSRETNLEKYGSEYAQQSDEIKDKIKATNLERYGTEYPSQLEEYQIKRKSTNLQRYGFEHACQSEDVKAKTRATNLERYGYEYVLQNPEMYEKMLSSGYIIKTHESTGLKYQGSYELDFLEWCVQNNVTVTKPAPIKYEFNGTRYYYPDFYHEPTNTIIEVKSTYTYNKQLEKNKAKEAATINAGFNYVLVLDKDYSKIL
jgi:hypothetical protein